jgi:hypothetical protein
MQRSKPAVEGSESREKASRGWRLRNMTFTSCPCTFCWLCGRPISRSGRALNKKLAAEDELKMNVRIISFRHTADVRHPVKRSRRYRVSRANQAGRSDIIYKFALTDAYLARGAMINCGSKIFLGFVEFDTSRFAVGVDRKAGMRVF